jgi:glycosyltransferase involved in cell wall biosynthesis
MRVSVVVDNHNYERFLRDAIDSARAQEHPDAEVIVVDDGSTDGSREVIAEYGEDVRPVLKEQGGQASALNAGFRASTGDVVIFLDADDTLLPGAVAEIVRLFRDRDVVKVHWPLWEIDDQGRRTGNVRPRGSLPAGDMSGLLHHTPEYLTPPQSGTAWSRSFLEAVLPLPERGLESGGSDIFLSIQAIAFGELRAAAEPLGEYRLHSASQWTAREFEERVELGLRSYDIAIDALEQHCRRMGLPADPAGWRRRSWFHRVPAVAAAIDALIPTDVPFILVDDDNLGMRPAPGRRPVPFLERDGNWWGPPADDRTAIVELERLREAGARFLVFAWPAFWWLDYYSGFADYVQERFERVAATDHLLMFDLGAAPR